MTTILSWNIQAGGGVDGRVDPGTDASDHQPVVLVLADGPGDVDDS